MPLDLTRSWPGPETMSLDLTKLRQIAEPATLPVADLIHNGAPDEATRTMIATALVMGLWQLCGRKLSNRVPSFIFLNGAGCPTDHIDEFTEMLVGESVETTPNQNDPHVFCPTPENARPFMEQVLRGRDKARQRQTVDMHAKGDALHTERSYYYAQKIAFRSGRSMAYAAAWDEKFGLITDANNEVILRLHGPDDRALFQNHLFEHPERLFDPKGIAINGLQLRTKSLCVSGSLTPEMCEEKMVTRIISLGLPILFLPHLATAPVMVDNEPFLTMVAALLPGQQIRVAEERLWIDPTDWFLQHSNDVRRRLRLLSSSYEFSVLLILHQLASVCDRITNFVCRNGSATPGQHAALFWDLNTRAHRGVTLGVASLAWYCLGFDPGCPRTKALKVLNDLRTKGPMTSSEIMRSAHLNKDERNLLLQRLLAEDLIRVEDKVVTAASFAEFVGAIQCRPALPEAANFFALVAKENEA